MVKLVIFLLIALVIEALGVVWLSQGLKQIGELRQISWEEITRVFGRAMSNPSLLLGIALEATFFVMLLVLLKQHDVSLIWPLTSLGFILTVLAAKFIRHETISPMRWAGVVLIVIGAGLVGWSERNKTAATANPSASADLPTTSPAAMPPPDGVSP